MQGGSDEMKTRNYAYNEAKINPMISGDDNRQRGAGARRIMMTMTNEPCSMHDHNIMSDQV